MAKVAIIIPTKNRPDFVLRQFRFYELMNSPHSLYISDSSNEENAQKIKEGIKRSKLNIIYQWVEPGRDYLHQLLPLVKEKYCIQMGDDDLVIPETMSECGDFLEGHPDYAICAGQQINIRFRKEDYNKSYGIIERQTRPMGRSVEDEDMLARIKNFWSDPFFIGFVVTRIEVEKKIRDITKHFSLMELMVEFALASIPMISGKSKTLNKLGYIMQVSDNRYNFIHDSAIDMVLSSDFGAKWDVCKKELLEILQKKGKSEEESLKIIKWLFMVFLAYQFSRETGAYSNVVHMNVPAPIKKNPYKKVKDLISKNYKIKKLLYRLKSMADISNVESVCLKDFESVKKFLEQT